MWTDQNTRRQAVIWENGTPRLLGRYQTWNSTTLADVNSSGVAVGSDSDGEFSTPVRYRNGSFEPLPQPVGTDEAWPAAINRSGTVVWGTRAQLTPAQPGWWVAAEDIRAGRVVGTSGSGNGDMAAVEWDVNGRITRVLPGGDQALAVNAEGVVLGVRQDANVLHPVVWLAGSLPLPPNSRQVSARVLTDDGVVFGSYTNSANDIVPLRWTCG